MACEAMRKGFKEIVCGVCESCRYVQGFKRKCSALVTMCKGFIEMWRHVWLRAKVLKEMLSFCHYV